MKPRQHAASRIECSNGIDAAAETHIQMQVALRRRVFA
jgi:hypothetical protein